MKLDEFVTIAASIWEEGIETEVRCHSEYATSEAAYSKPGHCVICSGDCQGIELQHPPYTDGIWSE